MNPKPFPLKCQLAIFNVSDLRLSPTAAAAALKPFEFQDLAPGVEGASVGWVAADDAHHTPEHFDPEHFEQTLPLPGGRTVTALWWRMRVDARKVPKHLVDMRIEAVEKVRGRRLSKTEKAEIRETVAQEVLPNLPTTTKFFHVAVSGNIALLTTCSKANVEDFVRLMQGTFVDATILQVAARGDTATQPSCVLTHLLACETLKIFPAGFAGRWIFDGGVTLQNVEERLSIATDGVAVLTDACTEALASGALLRSASFTLADTRGLPDDEGPIWKVRADMASGAVSCGHEEVESEPEDQTALRLATHFRFADLWISILLATDAYKTDVDKRCTELMLRKRGTVDLDDSAVDRDGQT